ncbi:MAG: SPOR domain-containing protein [Bacteroidales bacterium]
MELESAIQELLSRLEFVSLPGLGSFVKKYKSASLSTDGKTFNPPLEFFVFDTTRLFNDEAIENFICDSTGVDHKSASLQLEYFVKSVKERLTLGNEVVFEGIGVLKKDAKGEIVLVSPSELNSQTFGLGKIKVETPIVSDKKKDEPVAPAKQVKVETKPIVKEIVAKPVKQEKSRTNIVIPIVIIFAVIAVVSVILFVPELRFWNGATSENEPIAQTSTIDNAGDVVPFDSTLTTIDSQQIKSDTATTVEPKAQEDSKPVIAVTDQKSALYYQETKKDENKTFYIIAGSFSQEINAQRLMKDLSAKGYKPELLQTDNMYRVAIYKFSNRDRALRELERLKAQKISDRVWMLSI